MIYFDTCAAIKLFVPEPESESLFDYLDSRNFEGLVSSELIITEVSRALRRLDSTPQVILSASEWLDRIALISVSRSVLDRAANLPGKTLRSLDAIHLATTAEFSPPPVMITYDERLRQACDEAGVPVVAPGTVG